MTGNRLDEEIFTGGFLAILRLVYIKADKISFLFLILFELNYLSCQNFLLPSILESIRVKMASIIVFV